MNHSGKPTMLNCINGIYQAPSDSIQFDGMKLNHSALAEGAALREMVATWMDDQID